MCFAIQGSILILIVIHMLSNQDEYEWQIITHQKNYDKIIKLVQTICYTITET